METKENQPNAEYIRAQIQAVLALRACGIGYNLNDRVEPFKCFVRLRKSKLPSNLIEKAKETLTTLVLLRLQGLEPERIKKSE